MSLCKKLRYFELLTGGPIREDKKSYEWQEKAFGKNEKLDKDADIGDYVKDFKKSDAPQFKGKINEEAS